MAFSFSAPGFKGQGLEDWGLVASEGVSASCPSENPET